MGAVESTQTINGKLPTASLSEIPETKTQQRIGDSNRTIAYGAHIEKETGLAKYTFPDQNSPKPARVDLRQTFCSPYFPAFKQWNSGSCTSQSVIAAFMCMQRKEAQEKKQTNQYFVTPSAAFNYYYARLLDQHRTSGAPLTDLGTSLTSALQAAKFGLASNSAWKFDPAKVNQEPSPEAQRNALYYSIPGFVQLTPSLNNVRTALHKGIPVLMSFAVTRNMDLWFSFPDRQIQTDYLLTADTVGQSDQFIGGHSVLLVGYDDAYLSQGAFIARNSWGPDWGQNGHFLYQYAASFYPDLQTTFFIPTGICSNPIHDKTCVTQAVCSNGKLFSQQVCSQASTAVQPPYLVINGS